jgi:hypothetical protein
MKCSILYIGGGLRLIICACYSWEVGFNATADVPFENLYDWKEIWEEAEEDGRMKSYITNY